MVVSYFGLFVFFFNFSSMGSFSFYGVGFSWICGFFPFFSILDSICGFLGYWVFMGSFVSSKLFLLLDGLWDFVSILYLWCVCLFVFLVKFANSDFRQWDVLLSVGNCVVLFNWSRSFMISLYVNGDCERLFSLFCFVCLLVLIC